MTQDGEAARTRAPDDAEVVCGICGRAFESEVELERHVNDVGLLF